MSDTRLTVVESITKVPRPDWQRLTASDAYGQIGWLRTVEATVGAARKPRYFLLYREEQLIAAAVGYRNSRRDDLSRLDDLLFGRWASLASRLRLTPGQSLYFGPLIGHGRHIFWDRNCSAEEADKRIRLILEQIEKHNRSSGTTVAYGRIPAEEVRLLTALRRLGYLETQSWPISYLNVLWSNFEDYVSSLSVRGKSLPTKVRREVAAPQKSNVEIRRIVDFEKEAETISRLFNETRQKHSDEIMELNTDFVRALATNHTTGSVMNVAGAESEPGMLGCALLLVANGEASGPLIGVAEGKLNRNAFTYFNLALYAPIRFCIENNIRRIYFGGGLRRMKQKRGCEDMGVYIFLRPAGPYNQLFWRAWFAIHRYWIRRKTLRDKR